MTLISSLLTTKEAARMLKISDKSLERKRMDGTGPKFKKVGRRVLYSEADLQEWLDSNTFQSTSEYKMKEVA